MTCGSKKVLVTGATGLIGKELIKPLFEAGFDVYAITIDAENPNNGVNWVKGSLFDEVFIKTTMESIRPEYLLNMAWATTGDYLSSDINYKFLNAGINLLKYFKDNGGKRIVCAGTCFEYKFKDEPLKETDELDVEKTVYTFCKNKLYEITKFFCEKNDISFGYGRIFYVYGRNEDKTRLTGMVLDKLGKDEEVVIKTSDLRKDYMYSKDIANAFVKFLDSNVEGVVNICTGKQISIKEFVTEIGIKLGKTSLLKFQNEKTSQPPLIVGDNCRLMNEVGYKNQYTLETAIEEILNEK